MYFDTHAHYDDQRFDPDRGEILSRMAGAGVELIVDPASDITSAKTAQSIAREYGFVYFAAGVHPHEASEAGDNYLDEIRALSRDAKCVAVGEIGLDYHYGQENKAAQRDLFIAQLHIAHECRLPVQIHSRDACADTLAILRDHAGLLAKGFLMHCYSYGAENLDAFLQLGAYFSFGGVLCFKNARRAVEAAAICPIDRLLTETDSPYLSPFRGEKNTPANIPVIAERLAGIRGMPLSDLAAAVDANASRLFGI